MALAEPNRLRGDVLREAAFAQSEQELREVAFDPRERDLGLGIPEAGVVLEHLPAVRGLDEPRVQDAAIRRPALCERGRDRRYQLLGDGLRLVVGQDQRWRERTHATGVRPGVSVAGALVIACRR